MPKIEINEKEKFHIGGNVVILGNHLSNAEPQMFRGRVVDDYSIKISDLKKRILLVLAHAQGPVPSDILQAEVNLGLEKPIPPKRFSKSLLDLNRVLLELGHPGIDFLFMGWYHMPSPHSGEFLRFQPTLTSPFHSINPRTRVLMNTRTGEKAFLSPDVFEVFWLMDKVVAQKLKATPAYPIKKLKRERPWNFSYEDYLKAHEDFSKSFVQNGELGITKPKQVSKPYFHKLIQLVHSHMEQVGFS